MSDNIEKICLKCGTHFFCNFSCGDDCNIDIENCYCPECLAEEDHETVSETLLTNDCWKDMSYADIYVPARGWKQTEGIVHVK